MAVNICCTANLTWLLFQPAIAYRIRDSVVSAIFVWVFFIPLTCSLILHLTSALVILPPHVVVFSVIFQFCQPVFSDITLVALFAFVDVSISHLRVLVERCEGLLGPALKAFLGSHSLAPCNLSATIAGTRLIKRDFVRVQIIQRAWLLHWRWLADREVIQGCVLIAAA